MRVRWFATAVVAFLLALGTCNALVPRTITTYNLTLSTDHQARHATTSVVHCSPAVVDAWRKPDEGWFGYAPNTSTEFHPGVPCTTGARVELGFGLVLLALGAVGAWLLLRRPHPFVDVR